MLLWRTAVLSILYCGVMRVITCYNMLDLMLCLEDLARWNQSSMRMVKLHRFIALLVMQQNMWPLCVTAYIVA
jgi:hypothetical protein